MNTLEVVDILGQILKMIHSCRFYYVSLISNIANCICRPYYYNVKVASNRQYVFVSDAKSFPAN